MKFQLWANHYSSDGRLVPKNSIINQANAKAGIWHCKEPSGVEYDTVFVVNEDGKSPLPSSNCKPLDEEARKAFKEKYPSAKIDIPPPAPLSKLEVKPQTKAGEPQHKVSDVPDFSKVPS